MNYAIYISARAENDLADIFTYITNELCNPEAAEKLLTDIEKAISSLQTFPERFPVYDEVEVPFLLRRMVVSNFLVFYTVEKENARVIINTVLYAQRNLANLLK